MLRFSVSGQVMKRVQYCFLAMLMMVGAFGTYAEDLYVNLPQTVTPRPYLRFERPAYRNFAVGRFENYSEQYWPVRTSGSQLGIADGPSRPQALWSPLGDYQVIGYDLFSWIERRQPEQRSGSALFKDWGSWQPIFTNVVVARDGYGDWGYSAIVGDGLIARLSPLTLSRSDLNGLRFDLARPRLKLTGLASRISKPNRQTYQPSADIFEVNQRHLTMLLGGRLQTDLGVLSVGFNGANLHTYTSNLPGNSIKGALRQDQPLFEYLVVRISDDAPYDGQSGAMVQSVQLIVNGEARSDLRPHVIRHLANAGSQVGRTLGGRFIAVSYTGFIQPEQRTVGYSTYYQRTLPLYADYLYRVAHDQGVDVSSNARVDGLVATFKLEAPKTILYANGDEQLIYLFDLQHEKHLESVEVEAMLGNDYRVEWSGLFVREGQEATVDPETHFQSMYYQTALRSEGRVNDLSNLRWVRFAVGENTGLFTYSADLHLQLPWLEVTGEYARSAVYSRYPAELAGGALPRAGSCSARRGSAYYVQGVRSFGRTRFGAEYFSMNRGFTTEMQAFSPSDTGRRRGAGQDPFEDLVNDTVIWRLVQDNDDGDRWPDILAGNVLGSPQNETGTDLDGIFPGQDKDFDGVPDTDSNFNGIPDYEEPFLRYRVEPNEYVYGLDRNNNGEPDHREDDWVADYPYEADQRGHHLFVQGNLSRHWFAAVGRYAAKGLNSGGQSRSLYALFSYRRDGPGSLRSVFFENQLQRLNDDIPDDYTIFEDSQIIELDEYTQTFTGSIKRQKGRLVTRDDQLFYQDSFVNETYLEGSWSPWSQLHLEQMLRLRLNWQQGGELDHGLFQRGRRLDYWTFMNRVEYTLHFGRLQVSPRHKFLFLRLRNQEFDQNLRYEYQSVPILNVDYPLLKKTTLQVGLQGWGPLPYRVRNYTQRRESFKERITTVTLINGTRYFGYDLFTIVGVTRNKRLFDDPFQRVNEVDGIQFFARALVGFTEFGLLL